MEDSSSYLRLFIRLFVKRPAITPINAWREREEGRRQRGGRINVRISVLCVAKEIELLF